MYEIALYGSNTPYKSDADSTIDLSVLDGTTNPMTDSRWLKVRVTCLKPEFRSIGDVEEGNGGIAIAPRAIARHFTIETDSYTFPDDMTMIDAIGNVLNHRRVFLFKGTYPDGGDWRIHAGGKALNIVGTIETEHEVEYGTKMITISGREFRPRRS